VRKLLDLKEMSCSLIQKSEKSAQLSGKKELEGVCHTPGVLYDYQKKEVEGGGFCKTLKRNEVGKRGEAGTVRIGSNYTGKNSIG